jgi:hypothetical protein
MGGTLARPQDQWPTLFAHPFWNKYPYFLPCAMAACLLVLTIFTVIFFLKEVGPEYVSYHTRCSRLVDFIDQASTKVGIGYARWLIRPGW